MQTTPLHQAAAQGDLQTVQALLENGADPWARDQYGEPPFFLAAAQGQVETARFFLERGADPEVKNNAHFSPLHFLARHAAEHKITRITITEAGQKYVIRDPGKIAQLLRQQDPTGGKFDRMLQSARLLLEYGANVDARTDHGTTPLHMSAAHGPLEFVRLLLQHGADVDARDRDGLAPLHFAARAQKLAIVIALVESGADLHTRDNFGSTPLHEAAESGRLSKVRYLIEQGADPDARLRRPFRDYKKGFKPADIAARRGHSNVARLIEKLIEIKRRTQDSNTL